MTLAVVSAQGQVYEVRRLTVATQEKRRGGGLRGVIAGFSRASRRRLIDLTARLDTASVRKSFLTLTFSGLPEIEEARAAFKRFSMRLRRAYPGFSAVWRYERQQRGAIHFHLICFNLPYIPQKTIQKTWEECTKEQRSIVHIKLLNSSRAVMFYVSKYIAKNGNASEVFTSLDKGTYQHAVKTGRHWGYVNRNALPLAEKWEFRVSGDDEIKYAMWSCYALSRGAAGRSNSHAKLFCGDAIDMLKHTLKLCGDQGWRVLEELRLRHWRALVAKMPYVKNYPFIFKPGWRPLVKAY